MDTEELPDMASDEILALPEQEHDPEQEHEQEPAPGFEPPAGTTPDPDSLLTGATIDDYVEQDSKPKQNRYDLTGLTERLRQLKVGTGITIPARDDWDSGVLRNLRNRIGTICHRLNKETGDRYSVSTGVKGIQIWRLTA